MEWLIHNLGAAAVIIALVVIGALSSMVMAIVGSSQITLSWGDIGAIFGIVVSATIAAAVYIRLLLSSELGKSEVRIMDKIKLAFAQKEITDLKLSNVERDVSELKKATHDERL